MNGSIAPAIPASLLSLLCQSPDAPAGTNDTMVGALLTGLGLIIPMGMRMDRSAIPRGYPLGKLRDHSASFDSIVLWNPRAKERERHSRRRWGHRGQALAS